MRLAVDAPFNPVQPECRGNRERGRGRGRGCAAVHSNNEFKYVYLLCRV